MLSWGGGLFRPGTIVVSPSTKRKVAIIGVIRIAVGYGLLIWFFTTAVAPVVMDIMPEWLMPFCSPYTFLLLWILCGGIWTHTWAQISLYGYQAYLWCTDPDGDGSSDKK